MSKRRELAAAIDVRWTPEIAARVKGRLGERLAVRRRRRRQATLLVTLLAVGVGGLALAWVGGKLGREPRDVPAPTRPHEKPAASPATSPAPGPPAVVPAAAPPVERAAPPVDDKKPAVPPRRSVRAAHGQAAAAADVVGDLMAAADAARLAGRPEDAVAPLSEITDRHASDPRAAIAAFQLGRVFAGDLHDPTRAARAFSRAYELDPDGPLARDAQARAAEAARR